MLQQFAIIIPELTLLLIALGGQLMAVFCRKSNIIASSAIILTLAVIWVIFLSNNVQLMGFNYSFAINDWGNIFKSLVLILTVSSLILYKDYCKIGAVEFKMEFVTLILLSTLGIFITISSRNFLLLFCGLEMQALSGYALAAFNTANSKSSEAGLKYFVLGGLVSCLTLFGISFIYGFGGSLQFYEIGELLNQTGHQNIGLVVGIVLMLSGIFFKLSAAPMHIWAPDVYEGAPIAAVNYFATAQKIGILAVLLNIMEVIIGGYGQISVDLVKIIAILSMVIGALGAIRQNSLKRLMAYSTVLNVGYVLIGISLHSQAGKYAAIMYLLIYVIGVMGFFACLVGLVGTKSDEATFDDIKGAGYSRKALAGAISVIMFSNIGLPPLAGFFGKYFLFYQAISQGEYLLAFVGIATSVIAAFYYLKVIKSMYFADSIVEIPRILTRPGLLVISSLSIGFILFFSIFAASYFPPFT